MTSPAPRISLEFFPPQSMEASFRLWDTVNTLAPLSPDMVSVTYGAGGTTRALTHDAVGVIHKNYGLRVAAHLTCVDATRDETMRIAESYAAAGVTDIVALRGDPPKGADRFEAHPEGFASSVELIKALAGMGTFQIHVGAYPDRHPEAVDDGSDIDWLKAKIDAGARSAITQFFHSTETFFRFRDRCVAAGITAPIVPGILPIDDWAKVRQFSKRCGAIVPDALNAAFEVAVRDGREELLALAHGTEMCSALIDGGVEQLHFYTLNRPDLTRQICGALGIWPEVGLAKVA